EHGCEPAESVARAHHLYDRLGRRRFCQLPSRYLRTRCKIASRTRRKVNRMVSKVFSLGVCPLWVKSGHCAVQSSCPLYLKADIRRRVDASEHSAWLRVSDLSHYTMRQLKSRRYRCDIMKESSLITCSVMYYCSEQLRHRFYRRRAARA